jgi:hypothetical protein
MTQYIQCPADDAPLDEIDAFGVSYNAYDRLTSSPERLGAIVRHVLRPVHAGGPIPDWAGLDLLRATLFVVHRQGHWASPSKELEAAFRLLISRIRVVAGPGPLVCDSF